MGLMKVNFRIFYKDKEILAIDHYSIVREHQPYLILIVQYRQSTGPTTLGATEKKKDDSWRELMDKEDLPLFEALRDWRSTQCKIEDVPPYVLGNNKQLAEMVHARPKSLAELAKISGFGKNKIEKYGKMILQILTTDLTVLTEKQGIFWTFSNCYLNAEAQRVQSHAEEKWIFFSSLLMNSAGYTNSIASALCESRRSLRLCVKFECPIFMQNNARAGFLVHY